jgi:SAM-dependent methyltransferase
MNKTKIKARRKKTFGTWILDIFISALLVTIAILSSYYTSGWPFVVGVSILGLALLAFLRSRPLSKKAKNLRYLLSRAEELTKRHPILALYYEDELASFEKSLDHLSMGRYDCVIDEIPTSSIQCINSLQQSGFVVYVTDTKSDYYKTATGQLYLAACYEAAEREEVAFTRLFVLNTDDSFTQDLFDLMEEHVKHGVTVLVAERRELEGIIPDDMALDFGLFDNRLLMKFSKEEKRSARLEVHYDDSEVSRYRSIQHRFDNLRSYEQFIKDLYKPINATIWSEILATSLDLAVPYALSEKDSQIIVRETLGEPSKGDFRVLVLGLTPLLIKAFNDFGAEVWCVDQANIAPKGIETSKHLVGNWLEFRFDQKFDAIVSDEGLNNLSLLQLRPFFQNMYNHLKQEGRLVMRVMCRVPGWKKLTGITSDEALSMIKESDPEMGEWEVAARMLRFLHCENFGFHPRMASVDPNVWNTQVEEWFHHGQIERDVFERWSFPYVLCLISPTLNTLSELPRGLFLVRDFTCVDESYCSVNGDLELFYRIASWTKMT